ncbi:hypothetical protein FEM48_Zijuj02G0065700 [Ziziphus jujuba var. spinosa]|uniref:Copper transport protein n=1 Tax=Ziziphus jujuba var. spinosa TaxID=714518 RepID=A0A978VU71_ZIZJJ|nr:hypothetical protein FEM48_Zijuj02G0065700 [Ziziphus jujuba var. spinosa]
MKTHLSFHWDKKTEIFFTGWPGQSSESYITALVCVFLVSLLVEWLSHKGLTKTCSTSFSAILLETLMHGTRVGLSYLVMLSVMSFNLGILLSAVAGYSVGFLAFGCRFLKRYPSEEIHCSA